MRRSALRLRGKLLPLEQMKDKRIALLRGAAQAAILKELGFHRFVEASSIDESATPSRRARNRIWSTDSSPET